MASDVRSRQRANARRQFGRCRKKSYQTALENAQGFEPGDPRLLQTIKALAVLYAQNGKLTPGELMDCQFFMWKSKDIAKKITSSPVLIVQGQKDGESIPIPSGAKKVFDKLSTDDKQMLALNDADHYGYEDPHVNDNAFNSTVSWIEAHVKDAKPAK